MPAKSPFFPIISVLARGGVGVLPTDTIYGIVGSALRKNTVRRIYALRRRDSGKPMIILISDARELRRFGISPDARMRKILEKVWPGKVSVILPVARFSYLHRGTRTLAFRVPKPAWLRVLLRKTGPLVAPSANLEGRPPARTISAAKKYFGGRVDFYVDAGPLVSQPSTVIAVVRK